MLADARIQLWTGEPGAGWGEYTLRFDGRIGSQPGIANGVASISFGVDDRWLDAPLLALYAGTGGIEGEAAQKGQTKPIALGAPRFVPGRLIDSVNNVIQLSAYGAIEAVDTAMDRLGRFAASSGNHASYAALIAATVPAGAWATCIASGLVRQGAPPEGTLSYHLRGDKGGPDGWARLPGELIRRIALLAGGAGKIDDASLDALDAARPWTISVYQGEQATARDLIQRVAASVNAVAGVDWLGRLFVAPIGFGASSDTLDATGAALPPVASVAQLEIDAPYWKLAIGAEPTWQVHGLSDVAFSAVLVERGRYDPGESYREGHIVDLSDGSRWLYVATTPSTGNAPVDDSVYWSLLTPATTYADGTSIEDLKPAEGGATKGAVIGSGPGRPGTLFRLDGDEAELVPVAEDEVITSLGTSADTDAVSGRSSGQVVADADTQAVAALVATANAELQRVRGLAAVQPGGDGADVRTMFRRLEAKASGHTASIEDIRQVVVGPGGGFARAMTLLDVDGRVIGQVATNDGSIGIFDFIADAVRFLDPDTSEPMIYFDVGRGLIVAKRVEVDTLKVNTAIIPVRSTGTSTMSGAGVGAAWQTTLSASIVMPVAGWIEATFVAAQGFTSGDEDWAFQLLIDGTVVFEISGGHTNDSIILSGAQPVAAGTSVVLAQWRAHSSVQLHNRNLLVKGLPATE
ncbi:MAG: hypothetical protein EON59_03270 [Alphaproteobacteria bacterium]|nr:MAG: hypothetical protein EON59_03270 [Alphaproteobacteria bacterium]